MSVRIVNAPSNPNNPVILYDNQVANATVTPSTEAAGFDGDNTISGLTYNFWKPTAMPATIEYDNAAFTAVDACGIAAHNLGSQGCGVTVQYWDGAAYQDIDTFYPVDDSAILFLFTLQAATKYRLSIVGDSVPSIGVVYFGKRLEVTRRVYGGHTPIVFSNNNTIRPNRSEGGQWLGRSVVRTGASVGIDFNNIEASWMRENWKDFVDGVVTNAFFMAWRPTAYPQEVGFCWTSNDVRASNLGQAALMSTGLQVNVYNPQIDYLSPHLLNPSVWLKTDYLHTITKDTSDLTSQHDDISGNGYNATATGGQQPTWTDAQLNGKATLVYDGSANTMVLPSGIYSIPNDNNTMFAVCKTDNATSQQYALSMTEGGAARYDLQYTTTDDRTFFQSSTIAATGVNHDMAAEDTDYVIHTAYKNNSTVALADNGGAFSTAGLGANESGIDAAYIGSLAGSSGFLDGAFAELIIFPTKLNDDDIVSIEKYLANQWGFNLNAR